MTTLELENAESRKTVVRAFSYSYDELYQAASDKQFAAEIDVPIPVAEQLISLGGKANSASARSTYREVKEAMNSRHYSDEELLNYFVKRTEFYAPEAYDVIRECLGRPGISSTFKEGTGGYFSIEVTWKPLKPGTPPPRVTELSFSHNLTLIGGLSKGDALAFSQSWSFQRQANFTGGHVHIGTDESDIAQPVPRYSDPELEELRLSIENLRSLVGKLQTELVTTRTGTFELPTGPKKPGKVFAKEISVSFSAPFSSPPTVQASISGFKNFTSGTLSATVIEGSVTTIGFKMKVVSSGQGPDYVKASWIALGRP